MKLSLAAALAALAPLVCLRAEPRTVPAFFVENGPIWQAQGTRLPVAADSTAIRIGDSVLVHEGAAERTPEPQVPGLARWYSGRQSFEARISSTLVWHDLYAGIDLVLRHEGGTLKSDYIVAAGAEPRAIRLRVDGPFAPVLDGGDLLIGEHRQAAPVAWQDTPDGRRISVRVAWKVEGRTVDFQLGDYERNLPLTIDPYVVSFAKWLGGSALDNIVAMAVDSGANVYLTGVTESLDFPATSLRPRQVGTEAFVIKLDATQNILWATWMGGQSHDEAASITLHPDGGVVVSGSTSSANFPLLNGSGPGWNGGPFDAFVLRLNASGALVFSTLLGGAGSDRAFATAVAPSGHIWVAGESDSGDFVSLGAIPGAARGGTEAFATRLSAAGTILSSTRFGGERA